jgi:hypothetical protein
MMQDWAKNYDALRQDDLTKKVEDYFTGASVHEATATVHRDDLAWALDRIPKRSRRSSSYLMLSKALEESR